MATAIELGTVSELAGALAWPLVVLGIVVIFRKQIAALLDREDVTVTGPGGLSLSAKRSAASSLVQAASRTGEPVDPVDVREGVEEMSDDVEALGRRPRVLWADDRPDNNRHERAALEALGISIDLSTSTTDALSKVASEGPYDLIISDMSRPPDQRAGYTLLDALRARGDFTPFVIYAGSRDQHHVDEAVRRGALGSTNRPTELIQVVSNALRAAARADAGRPGSATRKRNLIVRRPHRPNE